jgi:flagellar protein FlgJ
MNNVSANGQQVAAQNVEGIKSKTAAKASVNTQPVVESSLQQQENVTVDQSSQQLDFSSPQAFVKSVMPYAQKAAAMLGAAPAVLVAQAALETGWGQKAIRREDGSSSFNLFNIKADHRWQGDSISVNTLEYEQDLPVQRRAAFRAYESVAESFNDFVSFLKNSSRYKDALASSNDSANFLHNLQQAGYATDPRYAEKVLNVLKQVNSLL